MRGSWTGVAGTLVLAVLALSLAGCGDSGSSGAADVPTSSTSTTASGGSSSAATEPAADGCPYLTAEQVSDAVGASTTETAGTVHACFFDPEGGGSGPSVMLSRIDVQIDPTDYATQSRALCQGDVTDVDTGDVAFACVMGIGPQGQLYEDRVLVTVSVVGAADDAAGVEAAASLLPQITIPPKA